jgi:NAD(P)-dependent dehydrogenase (short-subunit alcohol dehydrogenase family)
METTNTSSLFSLKGRFGILTGAASGIGKASAIQLASMGAGLCLMDLSKNGLENTENIIKGQSPTKTLLLETDVSNESQINDSVQKAITQFGQIDFLVNCAGILRKTAFTEIQVEEWDLMMNINLRGPFLLCKAVAPLMISRGSGVIVNVASLAGRSSALLGGAHYTVVKHGIVGLSRHMARELGPKGVRVNAFCPGATLTPMVTNTTSPQAIEAVAGNIPRRKWAVPEEQASVISFLVSDAAINIFGACIDSNGGVLMV